MREDRIIAGAFVLSLLLHLVLAAATWRIPFVPEIDPSVAAAYASEVELLLVDPASDSPDPAREQPTAYTAIPDRLASENPPEEADYLALHDALAADRKEGDSDKPSADLEDDFNQVDLQREELDGAGGVAFSQQPLPDPREATGSPAEGDAGEQEERTEADPQSGPGDWALPSEQTEPGGETAGDEDDAETAEEQPDLEEWWGGREASILKEGERGAVGDRGFEFDQRARGDVGVGTAVDGDFSLNTYEWDFAPWMNRFENELHRHWKAPYAYYLGVISGVTLIRIVVEKDGRVSAMEVLETHGHESLHDASVAALKAFTPYAKLPPHFPEENLVILLSLHYPGLRRNPDPGRGP